jgi:nucleoside-diphosphate-sugar epimerase
MTTILVSGVGGPAGSNVAKLLLDRGFDVVGTDMRDIEFRRVLSCAVCG